MHVSTQSLTAREREMLDRLIPLVTRRAQREKELGESLGQRMGRAELDHQDRARDAESRCAAEVRAAEQAHEDKVAELRAAFEQEHGAAQTAMNAELGAFAERTGSIEAAAQQDLDDAAWLAETMVESAERKLKSEFLALGKLIAQYTGELDMVRREAADLLKKNGHPPLPELADAPGEAALGGPSGEPTTTRRMCELARQEIFEKLRVLHARVRPAILRPASLLSAVLVLAGGGAALGALGAGPVDMRNIGLGAGGGAALAVVLAVVLQQVLKARVKPAIASLGESLSRGVSLGARWLDEAEADRDRQAAAIREKRDTELRRAKERHAALRREVHRRKNEEEPSVRQRHESVLAAVRRRLESGVRAADEQNRARADQARGVRDGAVRQSVARRQELVTAAQGEDASARDALVQEWNLIVGDALAQRDDMDGQLARACPPWSDPSWDAFRPSTVVHPAIRFGEAEVDLSTLPGGLSPEAPRARELTPLRVPLLLDLHAKGSILLQAGAEGREASIRCASNILLRLLTALPPGKVRLTFIDPVGLGQSFAGFMHLADYEEGIVGDKIWTDPKRIEQKLTDLTEHMENVIQKYLRNEFATIHDYNAQAGEVAEPFRFLVLADFPAGLSEAAAKRLVSILTSGPRCGVYTIILADSRQRPPHWLPVQEIEAASLVLTHRQGRFACAESHLARWPIILDDPPGEEQFTRLIHAIGRFAKDSSKVQVPFEIVVPPAGQYWSADCAEELSVPVGRAGANKLQMLSLGRGTAQHVLIAGRTGSGKSTLLHAIITSISLWYRPEQVEYYLVDFKKGVEFKTYATHRTPHARVVAVESEREFGLSVLRRLDAELTRRGNLFRDAGVQDLAGYRRWALGAGLGQGPSHMPRALLIVDEFQEFFVEDDKVAQEAALLLDRLVRQGRAFGIHVILGSQTVGGAYSLARSTIGQMGIRVALQCSEADSYLIMSEDNSAPRLLSRPGEAIYNDASGLVEGNSPFQVVWLPEEKRDGYLDEVSELGRRLPLGLPLPLIVFEGNIPSDLSQNAALGRLLSGQARPAPGAPPRAFLGEPISIKDTTSVPFQRQSGSNVLVVGQQELAAQAMSAAAILSLLAHDPRARVDVLYAPGTDDTGHGALATLARDLAAAVRLHAPRDAEEILGELSGELERRRGEEHAEGPRRFLIVHGLQRLRALRRSEEDFGFGAESDTPSRPDQQFTRLLREGPSNGMHVIAWCDTVANLERTLDRRSIREFDNRVPFQMSANDSTGLIDSPQAVNLGRHRAILFSEELGQVEKFRPYAPPGEDWLARAIAQLAPRVAASR